MSLKCILFVALLAVGALSQQHGGHYGHHEEHYDDHPKYEYHYKVEDAHTRDYKEAHESRDGDVVKGFYWLLDADGYRRMVEYTVDGKSGFVAKVTREPTEHKPIPPQKPQYQHAPVHHAPTPIQHH